MKKIFISFTLIYFITLVAAMQRTLAQEYLMNNENVTTCSGAFYDSGGPNGNYGNNQNFTKTFTSSNGQRLRFTFTQFNLESGFDILTIWDGPNTNATLLGTFTGTNSPGVISSTGNSLTFRFTSDNVNNRQGWAADIECFGSALTEYNMSFGTVNTCSGVFFDAGGRTGSYQSNENRIQTFCSDNGQRIRFDFVPTAFNLGANDTLFAYDGNSVNAPLLGAYVTGSRVEPLTSSGTCITFLFKSDGANTNASGWHAEISCTNQAPAPPEFRMSAGIRGVCNGTFTDDGGPNADYSNSFNRIQTFRAFGNQRLRFTFSQFILEQGFDALRIWDGNSTSATFLGEFTGTNSPGVITSTGNALTFQFISDNSGTRAGWVANIECFGTTLTEYNMSFGTVSTCSGVFFDAGGRTGSYQSNENRIQTFCSDNGQRIRFDFVPTAFNLGANDTLFAYDGNSVNAPLIGYYLRGSRVEPIISSGTCITFRFRSDATNTNGNGWHALISCVSSGIDNITYIHSPGLRVACKGTFTDNGGNENYLNSSNIIQTFQSPNNERLRFIFNQFRTESGFDVLRIYDGPNINAPLIGEYSGFNSPGTITSSGNSITFYFISDNSSNFQGWSANFVCVGPALPAINMSNTDVNLCEGMWYDDGGSQANYNHNQLLTQTFCSPTGQRMVFEFNSLAFNIHLSDTLFVYDGNTANSPLLAIVHGAGAIEPIVSSGPCITFRFKSNATSNASGWQAYFYCTDVPPLPITYRINWGTRVVCNGIFTDDGGPQGNYSNSFGRTQTFRASTPGARLQFTFTQFQTESCCDRLLIYDGPSTASPLIGDFRGNNSPGIVVSTGNSLTFRFESDAGTNFAGWSANIACVSNVPSVGTLINLPYCAGATVIIPYQSPTQNQGNVFTAQLSDANGTFTNPINIGSVTATGSGNMLVTFPTNIPTSSGYRMRIVATNPATTGIPSDPFSVLGLPAQPASITGPNSVCANTSQVVYSVPPTTGASSYTWTVPVGSTITSGQGTRTVTVDIGPASGNISVVAANSCGNSQARTLAVTVNQGNTPSVSIQAVNAPNNTVCAGESVTFSANVNAGTNPLYQWIVNGFDFPGANESTFTLGNIQSATTVALRVTSTAGCFNPNTVTSSPITINLATGGTPSISIASNQTNNTVCSGQNITFTATATNGGSNPTYQWLVNGVVQAGQTGSTFTTSSLPNNAEVSARVISSSACANPNTATSNTIIVTVLPSVVPSVSISSNSQNTVCQGTSVQFTATATNGGTAPSYQWYANGVAITGAIQSTYTPPTNIPGSTTYTVQMTSNATCATPATVTSQGVLLTVESTAAPTATITSSAANNTICEGQSVTFSSSITNGGANPIYQWLLNGQPITGANGAQYTTSTLSNNAQISLRITSSLSCATPQTVTSNSIVITVQNIVSLNASVSSNVPGNTVCSGQPITFTATVVNGGSAPTYQWLVNGVAQQGQNSSTFTTSSLSNNAQVSVSVTSSLQCVSPSVVTTPPIFVTVNPSVVPAVSISSGQSGNTVACGSSPVLLTANPTNGGASPQYQWFLNGTPLTGANNSTYVAPTGTPGTYNYSVQLTSTAPCANPNTVLSSVFTLTVTPSATPTISITSSASGNSICQGENVTFTANITNGGNSPVITWWVNGIQVPGATGTTFTTNTLSGNATVMAMLQSSLACAAPQNVNSNTININVLSNVAPTVSISSNATGNTVCAGANVTFTATATNGGSNPQYQWFVNGVAQQGVTGPIFTINSLTGTAVVNAVLTSSASCANPNTATSNTITLNVQQAVTPSITINSPLGNNVCAGSTIPIQASIQNGGANPVIQWTVNGSVLQGQSGATINITPSVNTTVVAQLTSSITCAVPQQVNSSPLLITVIPAPTVVAQNDTAICATGNGIQLKATPLGGVWNGPYVNSSGLFTPAIPGTYTVHYQYTTPGSNCSGRDSVRVTVLPLPIINLGNQPPICVNAAPVQLSATPQGGVWSGPGVSNTGLFTPSAAGVGIRTITYTLTQNGCTNSRILNIEVTPPPTIDVGGSETVCATTLEVQLVGLPAGGVWTGQGVTSNGVFSPGLVAPGSTVTLTYTVSQNGCTASANKQINVLDPFSPVNVNAGPDMTVCINDAPFVLTGVVGAGGTWSGPGVSPNGIFNPAAAGIGNATLTYTVTFLQSPTCVGSDTRVITVTPAPTAPTTIGDTVCGSGSATLSAAGATTYRWYTTPTGGNAIVGVTGPQYITPVLQTTTTYYVSAVSGNCESNRTPVIAFVNNFNSATFSLVGGTLVASPANANAYQWLLNGQPIPGANSNSYIPVSSGDYAVRITLNGCTVTSPEQYILITEAGALVLEEAVKIWPNPASQMIYVAGKQIQHISLYNSAGKLIKEFKNDRSLHMHELLLPALPGGIYWLRIQQHGRWQQFKVAIQ